MKGQCRKIPKARLATKVAAVIKQFYRVSLFDNVSVMLIDAIQFDRL